MEPLGGKKGPVVHQMREDGPLYHSIPQLTWPLTPSTCIEISQIEKFQFYGYP